MRYFLVSIIPLSGVILIAVHFFGPLPRIEWTELSETDIKKFDSTHEIKVVVYTPIWYFAHDFNRFMQTREFKKKIIEKNAICFGVDKEALNVLFPEFAILDQDFDDCFFLIYHPNALQPRLIREKRGFEAEFMNALDDNQN